MSCPIEPEIIILNKLVQLRMAHVSGFLSHVESVGESDMKVDGRLLKKKGARGKEEEGTWWSSRRMGITKAHCVHEQMRYRENHPLFTYTHQTFILNSHLKHKKVHWQSFTRAIYSAER